VFVIHHFQLGVTRR